MANVCSPPDGAPVDSRTSGYLAPVGAALPDDDALDNVFQDAIAGISALDIDLVIPRGQATPPPQPPRGTTWCSFAVTTTGGDTNPTVIHDGAASAGQGEDIVMRSEELQVSTSFFGPAAVGTATLLRDGFGIGQNRARLRAAGIAYVGIDRLTFVPDLENSQFVRRADLIFTARRMAVRRYPIRNVIAVNGKVVADSGPNPTERPVTSPLSARS